MDGRALSADAVLVAAGPWTPRSSTRPADGDRSATDGESSSRPSSSADPRTCWRRPRSERPSGPLPPRPRWRPTTRRCRRPRSPTRGPRGLQPGAARECCVRRLDVPRPRARSGRVGRAHPHPRELVRSGRGRCTDPRAPRLCATAERRRAPARRIGAGSAQPVRLRGPRALGHLDRVRRRPVSSSTRCWGGAADDPRRARPGVGSGRREVGARSPEQVRPHPVDDRPTTNEAAIGTGRRRRFAQRSGNRGSPRTRSGLAGDSPARRSWPRLERADQRNPGWAEHERRPRVLARSATTHRGRATAAGSAPTGEAGAAPPGSSTTTVSTNARNSDCRPGCHASPSCADAAPRLAYARPRTRSMSRPSTRSPSARRPLWTYSSVIHVRRPRIAAAVSSANARSTYRSWT